jgi:hypothetical protein
MDRVDTGGEIGPTGGLGLVKIGPDGPAEPIRIDSPSGLVAAQLPPIPMPPDPSLRAIIVHGLPQQGLSEVVNRWRRANLRHLRRGWRILGARAIGAPHVYGALYLRKITGAGEVIDLGLASLRLMTDNGMGFVVDAYQNLVELENMKFHGFGTGTNAENATDSALQTEFTTQYATDNTRPTGTTAEASQKVYQTVATFSPDSGGTLAVTEHCVFSQAATGGGVAFDRSVFSAVNLVAGSDSLQATYQATFNSGG